MFSPDQVFQFCSTIVLPAWLLLMIAPGWKWTSRVVVSITVTILGLCYLYYIAGALKMEDLESFSSLQGIMDLFNSPEAVLAGWIHYLAFDLMVGWFIAFDSQRKGINRFLIIPCLLFSFMMGPVGLLLYLLLRMITLKRFFVDFD